MIACLRNTGVLLVSLLITLITTAQQQQLVGASSEQTHRSTILPVFFQKEHAKGSPYIADGWLRGNAELTDGRRLPETGKPCFFNFDKMNDRLYITDGISKIWNYPCDSVTSFTLADTNSMLSFGKEPLINRSRFLQILVQSEKGYNVYCEWITKLNRSNFQDAGYYTTGARYDEYVDLFNYYIVYPGHRRSRRLVLNVHAIRKALPAESARLDAFFSQTGGAVDANTFVVLMKFLNEKNGY
jgi:hypothetical protein